MPILRPSSPILVVQIFGKCDFPSCPNTAAFFCEECHYVEHCRSCFETMLQKSEIYNTFMRDEHQFTCIYCFIDLQKDEVLNNELSLPIFHGSPINEANEEDDDEETLYDPIGSEEDDGHQYHLQR
jgi:hypothetical protein